MFILLTNDDGYSSPGIQILKEHCSALWDTRMVAPDREQSAASHALTLNRPLRAMEIADGVTAVDGTPTDCVMLALKGLLDESPALVISGINTGANLGDDVLYSGTVAAAAEATILGIPAIAASLVEPERSDLAASARVVIAVARRVLAEGLPAGTFLNVNIPPVLTGASYEVTTLGARSWRDVINKKIDPRGRPYYWIGGQTDHWRGNEHCDFAAIERGNISITPLQLDMTAAAAIPVIASWRFE